MSKTINTLQEERAALVSKGEERQYHIEELNEKENKTSIAASTASFDKTKSQSDYLRDIVQSNIYIGRQNHIDRIVARGVKQCSQKHPLLQQTGQRLFRRRNIFTRKSLEFK